MKIVFRVDASKEIGIGHLMRCLALSEEFRKRGHDCHFLSKTSNPDVIQRIKKYHVRFYSILSTATIQQDRDALISYAQDNEIDWVITDHYTIDPSYVKEIKFQGFHVLSIDDTAQMHYYADIVVNQNIGAEKLIFSVEPYTTLLLGPSYTMLRDELRVREKKKNHRTVKKLLITLGGTDPDNFLLRIIQYLEGVATNLKLIVVIGPFNPYLAEIQAYKRETGTSITLVNSPENMADLYLQADLAVSAGGSSCYELAYFGIPNLIITVADNQLAIANELDRHRIGVYLGNKHEIQPEYLRRKIKELRENQSLRKHMNENGKLLVDGKGKERIVTSMEEFI